MNRKKIKLNRWAYGFAVQTLILGCAITMMIVYKTFPNIPGALEQRVNLDNLTQVIVPGSADITFTKQGAYAVYHEYRSVVNGVKYETDRQPPSLDCILTSKKTGDKVTAVPDYVESNTYSTKEQDRVGELIMSITIYDPGIYTFACQYREGGTQPDIVVSVGPNFMWEFFNIFAKVGVSILSGIGIFFLVVLASIIVILMVVYIRAQANKKIED